MRRRLPGWFTIVLLIMLGATLGAPAAAQDVRVKAGAPLALHEGPGTNYLTITRLPPGTKMNREGARLDGSPWIRVSGRREGEGFRGWVNGDFVERVDPLDWSIRPPRVQVEPPIHTTGTVDVVAVSDDRSLLASVFESGTTVEIWDFETGELLRRIKPRFAQNISIPNDLFFVRDRWISIDRRIYDIGSGEPIHDDEFHFPGPWYPLNADGFELLATDFLSYFLYADPEDFSIFGTLGLPEAARNADMKPFAKAVYNYPGFDETRLFWAEDQYDLTPDGVRGILKDPRNNDVRILGPLEVGDQFLGVDLPSERIVIERGREIYDAPFDEPHKTRFIGEAASLGSSCYSEAGHVLFGIGDELKVYDIKEGRHTVIQLPVGRIFDVGAKILCIDARNAVILPTEEFRFFFDEVRTDTARLVRVDLQSKKVTAFGMPRSSDRAIADFKTMSATSQGSALRFHPDAADSASNGAMTLDISTLMLTPETDPQVSLDAFEKLTVVDASGQQHLEIISSAFPGGDLAVMKNNQIVSVLDRAELWAIVKRHMEEEDGTVIGGEAHYLSELVDRQMARSFNAIFDISGNEIHVLARSNFHKSMQWSISKIENRMTEQGGGFAGGGASEVPEPGAESMIYSFSTRDGRLLGERTSEDHCSLPEMLQDGTVVCASINDLIWLDLRSGRVVARMNSAVTGRIKSIALLNNDQLLAVLSDSQEIVFIDTRRRVRVANLILSDSETWILLTPEGFYVSEGEADALLRVSYGVEGTYSIDRFRGALFRPDLVSEALKGDPEGLVRRAAEEVSLERILGSGGAPDITIDARREGGILRAAASITDTGGGIGRHEWRVNGVVQKIGTGAPAPGEEIELFAAAGENRVELIAYNSANTIQSRSEPQHFTVSETDLAPPRLFVLTIGVDAYRLDALTLRYAGADARNVAAAFEAAGAGLYDEIFVEVMTDAEVTRARLAEKFDALAQTVRPNDVFVFFSAGHGKTLDGRFFFIPQDFNGTTVASIRDAGIGHATWLEWFARIPAQKSLLMFDSCESGTLTETSVGRDLRFRSAHDLLGNASGRALMAASSGTGYALEGYEGQGVFAWSIIDSLSRADLDGNSRIDVEELANMIEETVPRIALEAFGEEQLPQFKTPKVVFDVVEPLELLIRRQ